MSAFLEQHGRRKRYNEKQHDEFQARKTLSIVSFFKEDRFPKKRGFINFVSKVQYYCAEKAHNTILTNFLRLLFFNADIDFVLI